MNQNLDELLSHPMAEMPDDGFSVRVMAGIARQSIRRTRIEAISWGTCALAAIAALAVTSPGGELAAMALSLNLPAQVGMVLAVVFLLFAFRGAAE